MEILSIQVRLNKELHGITCNFREIKLVQYANDTTGVFRDVNSARKFLDIVNKFSLCSGLKLNRDKTEALWLGKEKENKSSPLGISWPKKPIKPLGLYIGHNIKELEVSNFRHKIAQIKQLFNSWQQRDLSLLGRILIVKALAISKFYYLFSFMPIALDIILEINKCMFEFIWKGQSHKMKPSVAIQNFRISNIEMSKWLTYIFDHNV